MSLSLQNIHEDVYHLSKLKYPVALQECLSLNGAQQQYENTNKTHQRKNLNSPRHFQFLVLKKSRSSCLTFQIHLSRICQDSWFLGSPCDIKMLLELLSCLLRKFDWFGFSIIPKNFCSVTYTVANHLEMLKMVMFCAMWVTRMITL